MVEALLFFCGLFAGMRLERIFVARQIHQSRKEAAQQVQDAYEKLMEQIKRADKAIDLLSIRSGGQPVSKAYQEDVVQPSVETNRKHAMEIKEYFQASDDFGEDDPYVVEHGQ